MREGGEVILYIESHTRSSNFGQESHWSVLHFTAKFFLALTAMTALEQLACDMSHFINVVHILLQASIKPNRVVAFKEALMSALLANDCRHQVYQEMEG